MSPIDLNSNHAERRSEEEHPVALNESELEVDLAS